MSKLVIVESPTKVKKIQQYLPKEFKVDSCVGHIRDLPSKKSELPAKIKDEPWADYAVDVENGFTPYYVTLRGKSKVLQELKKKLKDSDELYLATDEDREGEAISWHLVEALNPKVPVKRMVFNEITKKAVNNALDHTRDLDMNLVQAQEARRILDRLYGYALSPLLWKKVGGNLSAGRVQSVAVRLVVMRERERRAFVAGSYWDLVAHLHQPGGGGTNHGDFEAKLVSVGGKRVANSKDFDKDTGKIIEGKDVLLLEEDQARELQGRLKHATWTVVDVERKPRTTSPQPPYTTSTMQQDANNRLGLSANQAMQAAQRLYQNGFITYMRTDSTALSEEAIAGAVAAISAGFGTEYLHEGGVRKYENKKGKGAQEAHEAIRPAGDDFVHPDRSGLTGPDAKLYRLIWQRTLASQMADERSISTKVTLESEETVFTATGKTVEFPGFRAVYPFTGRETPELPKLAKGDHPDCRQVDAEGHETKPPARYTEATLVKALEEEGIGRPSTYASIMSTIQDRGYVVPKGKALVPTFTAFAAVGVLERNFPHLVDLSFTADMEATLDRIAAGDAEMQPFLEKFFLGPEGLQAQIERQMEAMDPEDARRIDLGDSHEAPYEVRIGRFGPYVEMEIDGEAVTASIPEGVTPDELSMDQVKRWAKQKAEGPQELGKDSRTGLPVYVLDGRFGPYYQLGDGAGQSKPPRASLPKGKKIEEATLEEGEFLLSLPKELGPHPDGGKVLVGIGRYGPYVCHQPEGQGRADYRNLKHEDEVRTIDFQQALEILKQPKAGRGGRGGGAARKPLKDLGEHPKDGKPVHVLDGRYGPYVKHEKTNATIPKDEDPESITMARAVELLEARKAKRKR